MNAPFYHRKLERCLAVQGGLYSLADILERIADGRMQSWVENNSWAITQISIYPAKRLLEIVAAIGDLKDCRILHGRVLAFAKAMDVDLVAAYGRRGWARDAERHGWKIKTTSYLYHRDL